MVLASSVGSHDTVIISMFAVGCRKYKEDHHGYLDSHYILDVVHNPELRALERFISILRLRQGLGI